MSQVDIIRQDGKEIHLVKTAHVSKKSAELVRETILEQNPDTVCIELCPSRFESIKNPKLWEDTDLFSVIKQKKGYLLVSQLVLGNFQRRIAKKLGVTPGAEMIEAITLSEERGHRVELIDRDITTTLKRTWAGLGIRSYFKLIGAMIGSLFESSEVTEESIEDLKEGDVLQSMVLEFGEFLPNVKKSLIDERDQYMAAKIAACEGQKIVAVVGAGHGEGIKKHIGDEIDLRELEKIPPPSKIIKIFSWGFPLIVLGLFIFAFLGADYEKLSQMASSWILANGILALLGAIIALAHPLVIILAFISSPITSLNPAVAAGWVCAIAQVVLKKPTVANMKSLVEDMSDYEGSWRDLKAIYFNPACRVLLVLLLVNLGSSLGSIIGAGLVFKFL